MSGERHRFVRNVAWSYGQRALLALSALLLTPYLFRGLGVAGFGTWSVMFTLTTIFTMLEVGLSAGATKFVAEYSALGKRKELDQTVGATVVLMTALGAIAFLISATIALVADGLAADAFADDFSLGMVILGAAFLIRGPFVGYAGTLQGLQRYDAFNFSLVVTIVGFAAGAVVALETGGGVLEVAIAFAIAQVAGGMACALLLWRIDRTVRLGPRRRDIAAVRRILGFSIFTLMADAMIFIGLRFDTVIIAAIRGAAAAAPFAAATKLQNGLQAPTLPVINLMMPMVSDLDARRGGGEIRRRLLIAVRVTVQVTTPLAIGVALFATDIVSVWLGPTAPDVTADIIAILAVQTLIMAAVPADKVLIGVGQPRTVGILNTAEGLSNLAISIILVSEFGAVGAAIGTLVASFTVGPLKFPLVARAIDLRLSELLGTGILKALASSLPALALMLPIFFLFEPGAVRLTLGLGLGLLGAIAVGILQLGPGRLRSQLSRLSARGEVEGDARTSSLTVQGPS